MEDKKVYVLTRDVLKDDTDELDFTNICGVVSSMREAKAWAAGYGHNAYETVVDGDIVPEGINGNEFL